MVEKLDKKPDFFFFCQVIMEGAFVYVTTEVRFELQQAGTSMQFQGTLI